MPEQTAPENKKYRYSTRDARGMLGFLVSLAQHEGATVELTRRGKVVALVTPATAPATA